MNVINNDKILVAVDPKRGFELSTPILSNDYSNQFKRLFPKRKSISLIDILDTSNKETDFIDVFEPFEFSQKTEKPAPIYFYGNLIECNQRNGFKKISAQLGGLTQSKLEQTFREYFTLSNLGQANKRIRRFIDDMELSRLSETGDNQYYFTDKRKLLSHPTILCCSAFDFPYALDRLLGNYSVPIDEDDISINDYRSCTECLFGIAKLLGYLYAIRITDFSKFSIYGFDRVEMTGVIKPDTQINMKLIENNWDEILRFIATIKTGYTSASIIIPKFINRFDDPIFLGLREVGRIEQTIFILKYIQSVELRQIIEAHLAKVDIYKQMSASIQKPRRMSEFIPYESKMLNDACKVLIENCILAWNYLYLAKVIKETSSNKDELLKSIQYGYIPTWEHIKFMI